MRADPGVDHTRQDLGIPTLTARELDVVRLISEGRTNREIAGHLLISHETVNSHIDHILRKLGITSRVAAAAWWFNNRSDLKKNR